MTRLLKPIVTLCLGISLLSVPVYAQSHEGWPAENRLVLLNPGVNVQTEIDNILKQTAAALNQDTPPSLQQALTPASENIKILSNKIHKIITDTAKEQALVTYLSKYKLTLPALPAVTPLEFTSNPNTNILIQDTNLLMAKAEHLPRPAQVSQKWLELAKQDLPLSQTNPITWAGLALINMIAIEFAIQTVKTVQDLTMELSRLKNKSEQIQQQSKIELERDPIGGAALWGDMGKLNQVAAMLDTTNKTLLDASTTLSENGAKSAVILKYLAR